MGEKFTSDQFLELAYSNDVLNEEFLKKWNNIACIKTWLSDINPLDYAIAYNRMDMMKYLVENGADIISEEYEVIASALWHENTHAVKYLLDTGVYAEEYVHGFARKDYSTDIRELLLNYKKFSYTKAYRKK